MTPGLIRTGFWGYSCGGREHARALLRTETIQPDATSPADPVTVLPWIACGMVYPSWVDRASKRLEPNNMPAAGLNVTPRLEPRKILVAIDGTPITPAVLDLAAAEAISHGGELTLVHVRQPPGIRVIPGSSPMGIQLPAQPDRECDRILEEAAGYLVRRGVHVRTERCDGSVRQEIVRKLAEGRYDAVVIGCHGHRFPDRLLGGCTSAYLVKHAPCRVYIAHGATQSRGAGLSDPGRPGASG
jgi:nucleotide-binding universal stress UspA family protein